MKTITFRNVKDVAHGRWGYILSSLVGAGLDEAIERGPNRHSTCPIHGGTKPFRIFKDFELTGGCICSQCGAFSDGFAFLQAMYSWTNGQALRQVASTLGMSEQPQIARVIPARKLLATPKVDEKEIKQRQQRIHALWKQALTTADKGYEPMIRYIYHRGLEPSNIPSTLKMLLSHSYYEDQEFKGNYSTMIAPVIDASGQLVALHRTYLTFQGLKAPVECPKKLYTAGISLKSSAIRLFPAKQKTLGLCEGIETALAVNEMTDMPVWSCISAALLEQVQIPKHIKEVYIWTDKDCSKAGQKAATTLANRLYEEGKEAHIKVPDIIIPENQKSIDWLDVLNNRKVTTRRIA